MAYSKETKKASQDSYHEARAFGHTKEEARSIRDNWKGSNTSSNISDSESDDEIYWYSINHDDFDDED